ncbi:MarR family winged helix-turn-helix transcriptional regulator [Pseudactinotalea sp. HY158]|uniref:MarR family winged helix-turn-helix transcriptional regulator n=1 Tax=Pseudactinotalea sp. HY158 TaxID=2654547 RepID=UPI00129C2153|nr:MarR family transcriptional regulator [Pseudactinotalea sp. HY158]QGH68798.1 MarR family transcriptional regulator [Pseudactinotalea sp. HY158]
MKRGRDSLGEMIGYRLKEAQAVLRGRMDAALRPLGLTTPQYACLELLSHAPGASNSELARSAFVARQTMNTLLRGLHDRGLVDRAAAPPSGRVLPTVLTPEGRRLLDQAAASIGAIERQMVSTLTDEQRRALRDALANCIDALRD